jgi:uncharacterized protein YkwD
LLIVPQLPSDFNCTITLQCCNRTEGDENMAAMRYALGLALIWSAFLWSVQPVSAQSPAEERPEAQSYQMFVPMVSTDGPAGSGGRSVQCDLNEQEAVVADLMEDHPNQHRITPLCDPILAQVARARARDMALRSYFAHTNPDGDGPNLLVREAGYPLPDWYGDAQDANNIESIGAGQSTSASVWQAWTNSSGHSRHVLGTDSFYASQESYGVGYYYSPNSRFKHYWVFLSAPTVETN